MSTRRYYDQKDNSALEVDTDGPGDNNVLFGAKGDEVISLNHEQVENLISFLKGDVAPKTKALWSDV